MEDSVDKFDGVDPGWITATDAMDSVLASKLTPSELHELAGEILFHLQSIGE